jgi:putative ABC transport system permease protein
MRWNDLGYAVRMMRRTPVFTVAVLLTVALTVAANTTIFSAVNAVLIRPLPFAEPGRVIQVAEKNDKLDLPTFSSSLLNFLSWREQTQTFEELAAVGFNTVTLSGTGEPEQLSGNRISPELTRVLGFAPIAGRAFTADEQKPGAVPVAMIGEGLWKRRFGANKALLGSAITLDGAPTAVVGIAPAALNLVSGADVYTPLKIDTSKEIRLNHQLLVFGRLKRGVSLEQARAEMDAISLRVGRQYPEVRDWGIHLITLFDTFVSTELKTGLIVLSGAVVFVLLIACANIANLLLARAAPRRKEMAVRAAMGAGRGRLIQQLLLESVVLSLAGGAAGLLGSIWAIGVMNRALPPNLLPVPVRLDATVLWFGIGLTLLTGLIFGVAPAWRTGTVDLNDVLKQAGRGWVGGPRSLRNGLAAAELALATVLLIGAGLLIQSLAHLQRVRLGFDSHDVITFQLAPPAGKYPLNTKAPLFYRALLDSFHAVPAVGGAGVSSGIPFGAGNYTTHPMITTEPSILPAGASVPVDWRIVSPGYFQMMAIPLLRGRDFSDGDGPKAQLVMIVSQATARRFWGDADPIGRTLRRSADPGTPFTIVGVVGDTRNAALNQETPSLYYPLASRVWPRMDIAVRSSGSPEALLPALRQKIHELDPELALANVKTLDQWISNNAAQPKLNAALLSAFAGAALLIATIGIYGVLAFSVTQRTREIGLRMALGAQPRGVVNLIVGEGMKIVLIGIGIGVMGGLALGRALSSLVFGIPVRDPLTFAAVTILLAGVGLAASVIPASRASRVDPMVALRDE